ncbi:hypothetical protein, partial [Acinetobacter baumannii]|uniref:hypothetical protein n=1 Tax=Acinetobacter baumannii TaxID=470 RepID=UPI001BB467C3
MSRVPGFSGKKLGAKVPRESVLPLFVAAIAFGALRRSYPWLVLTVGTVAYLASLPFGAAKAQAMARAEAGSA